MYVVSPKTVFITVDLPAPLGPTMVTYSPSATSRSTSEKDLEVAVASVEVAEPEDRVAVERVGRSRISVVHVGGDGCVVGVDRVVDGVFVDGVGLLDAHMSSPGTPR